MGGTSSPNIPTHNTIKSLAVTPTKDVENVLYHLRVKHDPSDVLLRHPG